MLPMMQACYRSTMIACLWATSCLVELEVIKGPRGTEYCEANLLTICSVFCAETMHTLTNAIVKNGEDMYHQK